MTSTRNFSIAVALIVGVLCGSASSFLCPPDYLALESRCLHYVTQKLTWNEARTNCELKGGTLAQSLDKDTHVLAALIDFLNTAKITEPLIWLGATDSAVQGEWRWLNGGYVSLNSLFWHTGHINRGVGLNCMLLYRSGGMHKFADTACAHKTNSLCTAQHLQ